MLSEASTAQRLSSALHFKLHLNPEGNNPEGKDLQNSSDVHSNHYLLPKMPMQECLYPYSERRRELLRLNTSSKRHIKFQYATKSEMKMLSWTVIVICGFVERVLGLLRGQCQCSNFVRFEWLGKGWNVSK